MDRKYVGLILDYIDERQTAEYVSNTALRIAELRKCVNMVHFMSSDVTVSILLREDLQLFVDR